ncbi:hypothetical protein [Tardiphaga sp.]|jgi:hypothetical protein|uniref:hypothetical protein n=1 Tax=Tardiphaga sp. TaxID=1926292 RepID=UPI0037D99ADD
MPRPHAWHLQFDRVICRACGVPQAEDDGEACSGAAKIRPTATMRLPADRYVINEVTTFPPGFERIETPVVYPPTVGLMPAGLIKIWSSEDDPTAWRRAYEFWSK